MKLMNYTLKSLSLIFITSLFLFAAALPAGEGTAVVIGANNISAAAVSGTGLIELRVAGPNGFYAAEQSATGALDWYPTALADGEYRYEVFVTVGEEPAEGAPDERRVYRESGSFQVQGGMLTPKEKDISPIGSGAQSAADAPSLLDRLAGGVLEFFIPSAGAADLTASGVVANVFFDDTDVGDSYDWLIQAGGTYWGLWDDVEDGVYDNKNIIFLNHSVNSESSLVIDTNGDIRLANDAVLIDRSSSLLGIGTTAPQYPLHILSGTPAIMLDDTSGGDVRISNGGGELAFVRSGHPETTSNGSILTLEDNWTTSLAPGVGIWEPNPETSLHVSSWDGENGSLLVENTTAPSAAGDVRMFELRNTGDKIVRFAVDAGGGNTIWTFDNEPTYNGGAGVNSGRFRIAKSGTGVAEFTVDGYGNGSFYGNSYAVNHVNTSSRAAKTDFQVLDEQVVLAKLMDLEVSQWRYKQESEGSRHIGPVAEDFQQVFGLGDGSHISTVDSGGVALAAIKAVKSEKDAEIARLKAERDAQIARLKAEKDAQIEALTARLKALEALVIGNQTVSSR